VIIKETAELLKSLEQEANKLREKTWDKVMQADPRAIPEFIPLDLYNDDIPRFPDPILLQQAEASDDDGFNDSSEDASNLSKNMKN